MNHDSFFLFVSKFKWIHKAREQWFPLASLQGTGVVFTIANQDTY